VQLLARYDSYNRLQLVDCSPENFCGVDGHSRQAMMALIHARDAAGRWLIGAPVFAAAYRASGFASMARLWGDARLQPMWRMLYPWIARNRRWLSSLGATGALTWALQWLHARAARRALAQARTCADNRCDAAPRE
jgi:predicted DCC family thiol-disulfide oxidoreductase YuxK